MNKTQVKHYRMFLNTQEFLDNNTPTWSVIPRIVTCKNDFDGLLLRIVELSEKATEISGVKNHKDSLKIRLSIKVPIVSGALQVYAYDSGNIDLAESVKITKTDIIKAKDTEVNELINAIMKIANEKITELADYGISQEILTEILTTLDEYNALIGKPRTLQNKKFVTLSSLDLAFDTTNDLLDKKMDNLMLLFKETNPEFYEGYQRARVIVDN